jgi:hypothetical protein
MPLLCTTHISCRGVATSMSWMSCENLYSVDQQNQVTRFFGIRFHGCKGLTKDGLIEFLKGATQAIIWENKQLRRLQWQDPVTFWVEPMHVQDYGNLEAY